MRLRAALGADAAAQYTTTVDSDGNTLRYILPTRVAERYGGTAGSAGAGAAPAGGFLTLDVAINAPSEITSVTCPSHRECARGRRA